MIFDKKNEGEGLFKGVMTAYFILALHIILIVGVVLLVIFFRGIINYMLWIVLGGSAAIIVFVYLFYRRMKKEGKALQETLKSPMFGGRPVEVSLLGGAATFKIGRALDMPAIGNDPSKRFLQLEDPASIRIRELTELAKLLENGMITQDEYNKVKQQILKSSDTVISV